MSRVDHVVVTGAAGFIGAALVDAALARGARVTAIDRRPGPRREGVEHVVIDLADARCDPTLGAALRGADVVFHLAGLPGVRDRRPGVELARWRDNVIAGRVVLGATPLAVPVVVTSSSSVYGGARAGPGGATRPSHEGDPPAPRGGYARSKVALEALCAARRRAGGAITVVRPFTVAGEGQRADMGIARWLDACAHDQPVVVLGSLERTRDVTDVRDVVRGLWSGPACAADRGPPHL
jgi:nucleoside-diphosphate-sugar epimerase